MKVPFSNNKKRILNWRQIIPSAITIMAMLVAFISILITFQGMQGRHDLFRTSALLIMLAMILDGLDGNVARWLKGYSEFGSELDTYVDMTAFGIAPAVLIFAVTMKEDIDPIWRAILPSAVALSGMVRLARFKAKDPFRGQAGYVGLPITANAAWVSLFVFISQTPSQTPPTDRFSLREGWFATVFLCGVTMFIVLQITNFRYPKPTKKLSLFTLCVALVLLLILSGFLKLKTLGLIVSLTMIVLGLGYVIFGPLFVKSVSVRKSRREAMINEQNSKN